MIAILPMAILLLTAISLLLIRLIRPAFRYYWLVMTIGALFAWAAQLATRWLLPTEVQNNLWAPSVLLPIQWNWGFDQTAWSFSLTVITIWLASLLTGVARTGRANQPRMSAGILASGAILTTFLMLAVGSVHLSFLLFTWAVVDLCELIIYTVSVQSEDQSKNLSGWLITRFISLGLITWTAISSQPANEFAAPFLILAAMLRIGSIPPFLSPARQMDAPEPLESVLKFASLAPALALLVRISRTGIPPSSAGWLNAAVILALFYAGFGLAAWRWARRDDPLEGPAPRHEGPALRNEGTIYWVIGIGALAAAAAIGQKPAAAQAAGVSMLLAGSMLLQFSVRPVLLSRLFWIVAICLTGLAFTPTWPLSMLYSPISINAILLLLGHGLLIAGYLQQAQVGARDGSPLSRPSTSHPGA